MANILSKVLSYFGAAEKTQVWQSERGNKAIAADFFSVNGQVVWTKPSQANTAYYLQACPALSTIINRKAQAFINGRAEVLNFNTDNYVRGRFKEWERLLRKPNPLQTDKIFRSQLYSYLQAYKFCPVMLIKPVGFENSPASWQMWILPPQFLKITTNANYLREKSYMDMIDEIEFRYDNTTTIINKENLYFFTHTSTNLENLAIPDSALVPLMYPIENLIKNYESRGTIAEKRGAIGIISNNATSLSESPLTEAQKQQLQADYSRYGLSKDQWQLIITNASLSYQSMTMPIRDMMLLETERADIMTIADAFNYPSVLLANDKGTTYSNQEGAERKFYQDTIVPDAELYAEQLMDFLGCEQAGIKIIYDYEWLPVLQMDAKLKAQVRRELGLAVIYEFMNGVITWNEMKKALGQDTVAGMDLYMYQLPMEYQQYFLNNNNKQTNPVNGQGYQGDTNGQNAGVEGATAANNG